MLSYCFSCYTKQHNIFKTRGIDGAAGVELCPLHKRLDAELVFAAAQYIIFVYILIIGCRTLQNSIIIEKGILGLAEYDSSFMDKCDIVCDFFEVTGNMGREKDGVLLVLYEFQENIQYLVADDRVKTARSFIKNQKFGVVR